MPGIIRATAAMCLLAAPAFAQRLYSDPQGRFHLAAPAGWTAESAGEGVARIWRGDAFCTVMWMETDADSRAMVAQIISQVQGQWRNLQVVSEGGSAMGRLKGYRAVAVGVNPKGVPAVFQTTVAGEGNQRLGLICSIPQAGFAEAKDGLASLENSLGLGPGGGGPAQAGIREKLEALEAACRASVLTPEECEARRKALTGQGGIRQVPAPAVTAQPPAARGSLGIQFREVTDVDAKALGMQQRAGVWIAGVMPGSPAQQAGMMEGDILLLIDRQLIRSREDVVRLMGERKPGDTVEAGWVSRGQPKTAHIRLAEVTAPSPPSPAPPAAPSPANASRPQTGTGTHAARPGTIKLVRFGVQDPGVDNIEAVSFLIPAGWRTEGGIQWYPEQRILANLLLRISDPQTGAAIEFLPVQHFTYMQQMVVPMPQGSLYMGRVLWPPVTDISQFIRNMYFGGPLARLRNARQVSAQEMPEVAALAAQSASASQARSARVRYVYQEQGRTWEEDVYVTLTYFFVPNLALWSSDRAYSFRAPQGLLDRMSPLMATVVSTGKINRDWYAQYAYAGQLFDERMRQGIRGAAALSETIRRNNEEIRQMFEQSYRERSAAEDRIHQRFTEYIRGVETYRNPYEDRPVQLPSGYSNVWVNRNGEYILSNEAGFNPNVGSNLDWRPLERVQ
jgi:DNA-binding protein H-NS